MSKNHKEITKNLSKALAALRKEMPDVMNSFHALSQAATKDGELK